MVSGEHGAHHASQLLVVLALIVHKDSGDVFGVIEVAHGAEGNGDEGVVVVVAALHLTLIDTYHFKAHAIDADGLPQRRLAGEKPPPRFVADHHHSRALELILFAETSPRTDRKTTDAVIDGIHAGKEQIGEGARVMLNGHVLLVEDGSYALHHGYLVADVVDIRDLETYFASRLGASRLQGGAARKGPDHVGSPGAEDDADRPLEARAESQQDHHRGNPPGHAQHG